MLLGRAKQKLDMDASSLPADPFYLGASTERRLSHSGGGGGLSDKIGKWNEGFFLFFFLSRLAGFFLFIFWSRFMK